MRFSESLPNLNSQIEFVDITDHCAIHVSYPFSLKKLSKKTRKIRRFRYRPAGKTKILESVEKNCYFFPSDRVNDDVIHSVKILKQTIDE